MTTLWLKEVRFINSTPIADVYVEGVELSEDSELDEDGNHIESIHGMDLGVRISVENTTTGSRCFVVPWSNVLYVEEDDD